MARIDNPYIVGTPIPGPNYFFGRDSLLTFVRDTLNPPQQRVVVFYGQRRIGKTSLLLELQRQFTEDYHPVYFDLMGQANRPLSLALYEIAEQIAETLGLDLPEEFNDSRQFRFFLDSVFFRLRNRPLLLLFDEFDDLSEESIGPNAAALSLFDYLRDLLNLDLPIGFIFVVGRRLTELPQNFQSILKQAPSRKVGYLNSSDARRLITQPAKGKLDFSDLAIESIINLTSGHPYFMQLICFELFRVHHRQSEKTITPQDVEEVIESAIETGQGGLSWFWDALPPAERFVMSAMAEAGGEGGTATVEAFNQVLETHKLNFLGLEVTNAPSLLVKWEILQQTSTGYQFSVDLVRRWVRAEHPISKAVLDVEDFIPRAKRYYENAVDAHRSGQITWAIEDYHRAIGANPNHYRANMGLAQAYEERGEYQNALNYYQLAYDLDPDNTKTSLAKINEKLAHQLEKEGQFQEALQKLEKANEILESPTRRLQLQDIRQAIQKQNEKKEQWFRRIRYGVVFAVAMIVLVMAIVFAVPLIQGLFQRPDNMGNIQTAEFGEMQIIISDFQAIDDSSLRPAAVFEIKLSEAFPDIIFERGPAGEALTAETAVFVAEQTNSTAVLIGTFSTNHIEASLVFQNGVEYRFDKDQQYLSRVDMTVEDIERFADQVIREMKGDNLVRLSGAIANEDSGWVDYLTGRILLLNHDNFEGAESFINNAIDAGTYELINWQPNQGIDIVYVPGGTFERGRSYDEMAALCLEAAYLPPSDCQDKFISVSEPVQEIYTDHFLLDAYEVTNGRYQDCVAAGFCSPPADSPSANRISYYEDEAFDHYPVVNVPWHEAVSYCRWRKGRLPTEAEWEKAARWNPTVGSLPYPWGHDTPDATLGNFTSENDGPVEVGQYDYNSLGAYDMAGNVWEWVNDWYAPEYGSETENPQGPRNSFDGRRVLRGGAHFTQFLGLTNVDPALHAGNETSGNSVTGFRCAYDGIPTQ